MRGRHVGQHAVLAVDRGRYGSVADAARTPAPPRQQRLDLVQPAGHQRDVGLPQGQHRPAADHPRTAARPARRPGSRPRRAARSAPRGAPRPAGPPTSASPAASACRMASSGSPCRSYQDGRGAVQLGHPLRVQPLQVGAQQVGEQVVVAPPATLLVERDQEQAGPLHRLQHLLAVGAPDDRIAERAGQPLQDRRLQQERPQLLGLPLQHLLGQVVQHEPVAAGELLDEPGDVGASLQRQRGQLQPGRPALGALAQRRDDRVRQIAPDRHAQQLGRLAGVNRRSRGAQLGQLPAGPQPGQRQRRVAAAGQHQVQRGRQVVQQELQRPVHLRRVDQVVVVDDQRHVVGCRGELVDQRRHGRGERRRRGAGDQRTDPLGDPGPHPVQRGGDVAPEPHRVVVARVQRQPGDRPPVGAAPSRPAGSTCRTRPGRRPAPARLPSPARSRCTNRGRGTQPVLGRGVRSLVASSDVLS